MVKPETKAEPKAEHKTAEAIGPLPTKKTLIPKAMRSGYSIVASNNQYRRNPVWKAVARHLKSAGEPYCISAPGRKNHIYNCIIDSTNISELAFELGLDSGRAAG